MCDINCKLLLKLSNAGNETDTNLSNPRDGGDSGFLMFVRIYVCVYVSDSPPEKKKSNRDLKFGTLTPRGHIYFLF